MSHLISGEGLVVLMESIIIILLVGLFILVLFLYGRGEDTDQLTTKYLEACQKLQIAETECARLQERLTASADYSQRFENVANKVLDEKSKVFERQSEKQIATLLNPFGSTMKELRDKVTQFAAINKEMTEEAQNLSRALTYDVKVQGNWGEITLERILEMSGLEKGREYRIQAEGLNMRSVEHGRSQRPDVIINLPDNRHIVIDSKVSLRDYTDYCNAKNDNSRDVALKKFLGSVRRHVENLSGKRYQDAYGLVTLDFVIMFMPIDTAYILLMKEDMNLQELALEKNVTIVPPSTLLANLRTISAIWRLQRQNENAKRIAELGGRIYDKISGFVRNMKEVGRSLGKAQESHHKAMQQMSEGRGNILSQAEKLRELGVKTNKTMPAVDNHLDALPTSDKNDKKHKEA